MFNFIKERWKFILIWLGISILIPLGVDWFIIGNKFPSNMSNESWFSFLSNYLGGILGGTATLLAIMISFYQNIKNFEEIKQSNKNSHRLEVIPFLEVEIESANIIQTDTGFELNNVNNIDKAIIYMDKSINLKRDINYAYPYQISNPNEIVRFMYSYIEPMNTAYVYMKEVKIKNIGLQAAVNVNFEINGNSVWKYNLGKDDTFSFFLVISPEMNNCRLNISIGFEDLYGNGYNQSLYYRSNIDIDTLSDKWEQKKTSTPVLMKWFDGSHVN